MDASITVITVTAITVNGIVIATLGRAWLTRRQPPPALPSVAEERLENIEMRLVQLQQAVDDVAIEMERVAEGQRFATKLLAERAAGPSDQSRREREA
jgi:hypothetical protein